MSKDIDETYERATGGYEKQHPRINKPDMFMNTALWMEMSALAESPRDFNAPEPEREASRDASEGNEKDGSARGKPVVQESSQDKRGPEEGASSRGHTEKKYNKAGAVVILANDRALSVDCSQDGVHAAVSALNKFGQERAKGCQVYLSRRPCSYCAKLLVQCEVSKVYYLPIEPELNDPEDVLRVDKIFKASSTGLSVFIPKVSQTVLEGQVNRTSPYLPGIVERDEVAIKIFKDELLKEYWSDEWISTASEVLKWPAFKDENMKAETIIDMNNLMEWIARATKGDVPDNKEFVEIDPLKFEGVPFKKATGETTKSSEECVVPSQPTPNEPSWQRHALHMSRLAQMLSQRSDDPTKPVGCVLMVHNEVSAIGWNGFPAKALYGEFPRASTFDHDAREKKEPYVIHAEQNALLTRNKRNMNHKSSVLFSNKVPCGECVPLLIQAGVKNVVVPCEPSQRNAENRAFFAAIQNKKGKLKGYWPIDNQEQVPNEARRALDFETESV